MYRVARVRLALWLPECPFSAAVLLKCTRFANIRVPPQAQRTADFRSPRAPQAGAGRSGSPGSPRSSRPSTPRVARGASPGPSPKLAKSAGLSWPFVCVLAALCFFFSGLPFVVFSKARAACASKCAQAPQAERRRCSQARAVKHYRKHLPAPAARSPGLRMRSRWAPRSPLQAPRGVAHAPPCAVKKLVG